MFSEQLVSLTKYEYNIAKYAGEERRKITDSYTNNSRHDWTNDTPIINETESLCAELAVAKALNIYPVLSPAEKGSPLKFDLKKDDYTIDVKSTRVENGHLLIPYLIKANIYAFVVGKFPQYSIKGYIYGANVSVLGKWINPGKRYCWKLNNRVLTGWESVFSPEVIFEYLPVNVR